MHQPMQGQPCYRSAGQMTDQSRQGMSQNIGGARTPRHLMGLTPNPSIYGIQNMYPHQGAGTYRHGQPHQIITLVNPQGPYQYSGCNGHPSGPPSPYYMSSPPSSYPPIAFGHQPFMSGPPAAGPGYYIPEMAETSISFGQPCGTKREKKIIKIIDPKTGVNVIDELTGHRSVTPTAVPVSMVTEHQVSSGTYVIAAQFAAQVAATLTLPMANRDPRAPSSCYGSEVERGMYVQEYAEPLETKIQPVRNVFSPEAEKLPNVMKLRSRKKSKDVQKSTNGVKSSNLETAKGIMGSPYPEKLPDVKMSDGVIGDSLESQSLLSSGNQTELHLVTPPTSNAYSGAETCEGSSAMSGDGFGTMSCISFSATLGQDNISSILTSGAMCDGTVCGTTAGAQGSLASISCADDSKTYPEVNATPINLSPAPQDFVELAPKRIAVLLQSTPACSSLEFCHHHEDYISPGPTSFPEPLQPPCSSPNTCLVRELHPGPTSFPECYEPALSSPNTHLISELLPSHTSSPAPHDEPGVMCLVTHLTGEEQTAMEDCHKPYEEQTDQLPGDPLATRLDGTANVETEMLEMPASNEDLQLEMFPSATFHVEVLDLPDLTVQGDKEAISKFSEGPAEHGDGFQADYSHTSSLVEPNSQPFPPASCQLPDPVRNNSTSETVPDLDSDIQNSKSTDSFSNMASPVLKETDASETHGLDSEVSVVSTDRSEIGSCSLSGGQDRRSGGISVLEHGQHPLNGKQAGRDARKRSGPMSRPLSKDRLSYSDLDENDSTLSQDSTMLTASIAEYHPPMGRSYSLPMNRQESSEGVLNRSFSPNNGVGRSEGSTERLRNRTNLQLSLRSKMEDRDSIAEEPHRVKSPPGEAQLTKVAESRSKERRMEGQGRIQYDRNFLLQLQFEPESLQRPASLPCLPEIILDSPNVRNDRQVHQAPRKGYVDFTPPYARPSPGLVIRIPGLGNSAPRMPVMASGPSRTPQRRPMHQKEQPPPRKVIQVSLQLNVRLHTAENAWKPVHKKDVPEAQLLNEELYKKVRGILNKLTPQKFQTLIQQVYSLEINTEERLKGCIDLIFEKAISEPNFSVAYANMAKCLINLKVPTDDNPNEMVTFRKLLLNRCQREFEKDKLEEIDLEKIQTLIDSADTEEKKKILVEQKERAETKAKKRSLGNIRFIGELYKLKMLTENIMHDCILRLLKYSHDEDNLECLSRLLATIGQDIDHEKSKGRVDQYICQLRKIIDTRRISSRIKFMLQDLLELRKNGWVPRHEDNKPKTIEQIHKEAEQEEQQRQVLYQRTSQEHKGLRRPRTPGLSSGSVSEEGWRAPSTQVDPARMKLTKHQVDDNIQLGPGGRPGYATWQRGSSGGGSRTPSLEREKPPRGHGANSGGNDGYDYRSYGRSTLPRGKGLAMRSMEKDRNAAIAAVRSMAGNFGESRITPSNSRNASRDSSCNREAAPRDSHANEPLRSSEVGRGSANAGRGSADLSREPSDVPRRSNEVRSEGRNEGRGDGRNERKNEGRMEVKSIMERELSPKDVEKKTKSILEEYFQNCDLDEASVCVGELRSSKAVTLFITVAVNFALERSSDERVKTGRLLVHLVKSKKATADQLIAGFREVLVYAEDMEIDIPKIWRYFGELLGSMMIDGYLSLRSLRAFCEPLENLQKKSEVFATILEVVIETLGKDKLQQLWTESRLALTDFVSPSRTKEFVESRNMSWLQVKNADPGTNSLSSDLEGLISNSETSYEKVTLWIKANVDQTAVNQPPFIRALMTAICKSAIRAHGNGYQVDLEQLKSRGPLLSTYLVHDQTLEVQSLYALQNVMHNLQHPPSVLRIFFDTLYDEDIISEEAFNQWYSVDEPLDQQGKGIAKASVVQFFSWLHEADEQ